MSTEKKKTKVIRKVVKDSHLDYMEELYHKGIDIGQENIHLLVKSNRLDLGGHKPFEKKDLKKIEFIDNTKYKSDEDIEVDSKIRIIEEKSDIEIDKDLNVISENKELEFLKTHEAKFTGKEILTAEWKPKDKIYHEEDFVRWINSINSGFQNMVYYDKFEKYRQQSKYWESKIQKLTDFDFDDERQDYMFKQIQQCRDNSMFFLNTYVYYKEGSELSGSMKYECAPVHEVIAFLIDSGYSIMMGKPRQIAATTTLGAIALKDLVFNKNFVCKFITMDVETGMEIFDDKIKYVFTQLPTWMQPKVANDRDRLFVLADKSTKGIKRGNNSKLVVQAPSKSAINGGAPQKVYIDEIGYISMLGSMIKEARPTMFYKDPHTQKLELRRQLISWGTAGESDGAGRDYEIEYQSALEKWNNREFENIIIPVFFDWTTRPGITQEHYDKEKLAYSTDGPDKDEKAVQFRQAYPKNLTDMFLTSSKLLWAVDWIESQTDRINKCPHGLKPQKGFFKPIFDFNKPSDENDDQPYKIIGAEFVPTERTDPHATVTIFQHPKKNWLYRYYQGTDPISTDNGYSNMASSVFDAHYNTLSAVVDFRDPNHNETFLQVMLLGLYYDTSAVNSKKGIPELVEANIGTTYADYKTRKGYGKSLVLKTELEPVFQGGPSTSFGIDNRAGRTRIIINRMYELGAEFGDRFFIGSFWEQAKSFVCTVTKSGVNTWGTKDVNVFKDDVLFSSTFAYICRTSFGRKTPIELKGESDKFYTKYVLVRDANGNLTRQAKRLPVK